MDAHALNEEIRTKLRDPALNLKAFSRKASVSYDKLRRFSRGRGQLSITDFEKVFVALTGKPLITPTNEA